MSSRVVFVGNIPYDVSETQIIDILSEVGTVVSFKLVFDRETGRPKGFGFCTFPDVETAESAVRNLNNYQINGRQIKVDFAESDKDKDKEEDGGRHVKHVSHGDQNGGGVDGVSIAVKSLQPAQLVDIMAQLKLMLQNNPEQCKLLLLQNPQLSYAILQIMLAMNVVDQLALQKILDATTYAMLQQQQQQQQQNAMMMQQQGDPNQLAGAIQEQQKQLLLQVLNLTPDQIRALPIEQQQQILALRSQVMMSGGIQ